MDRKFELRDQIHRGKNSRTMISGPPGAPGCEVTFVECYPAIVEAVRDAAVPSLVVLALDEDGIAARAVLPVQPGNAQCATVGRHDRVEISLPGDPSLSLRHLLVVVDPLGPTIRYRVLDLHTGLGMRDETGEPLDGFEATGPMLVEVGRYVLLLVPRTHRALGWPADPLKAWQLLPRAAAARVNRPPPVALDPDATEPELLPAVSLPVDLPRELLDAAPVGMLEISSTMGAMRRVVGRGQARAGILLGRYDRCEAGESPVLDLPAISRVHALLLQVGSQMNAIDLGSVNGTWVAGKRVTVRPLWEGDELQLGRSGVSIRWTPVS